eukprot:2651137-Pleurochrysis_carterae.AAC.1
MVSRLEKLVHLRACGVCGVHAIVTVENPEVKQRLACESQGARRRGRFDIRRLRIAPANKQLPRLLVPPPSPSPFSLADAPTPCADDKRSASTAWPRRRRVLLAANGSRGLAPGSCLSLIHI